MVKVMSEELFKDKITTNDFNESIYTQLAKNMAKTIDIDLAKTPLVDLITTYTDYITLQKKYNYLQQENQQLKQALLDIKEYIETNSYFKDNIVKTMVLGDYSKGILDIVNKALGSDSNE